LCYSLPEKEYRSIVQAVSKENDFAAIERIRAMQSAMSGKQVVRLTPTITVDEKRDFLHNYEVLAGKRHEVLKKRPVICSLVDMAQRFSLTTTEYPFVGKVPPQANEGDFNDAFGGAPSLLLRNQGQSS
jgi:hypothetical protein